MMRPPAVRRHPRARTPDPPAVLCNPGRRGSRPTPRPQARAGGADGRARAWAHRTPVTARRRSRHHRPRPRAEPAPGRRQAGIVESVAPDPVSW